MSGAQRVASESDAVVAGAAAVAHWHISRRVLFHYIPTYFYLLLMYIAAKIIADTFGLNLNGPMFTVGAYVFLWWHVLTFTFVIAFGCEMLRVSHPGANNSSEVARIAIVCILYLVALVLAVAGVPWLDTTFGNSDFLLLTGLVWFVAGIANAVNSRTATRGIGMPST